jgi:hypothetical protein
MTGKERALRSLPSETSSERLPSTVDASDRRLAGRLRVLSWIAILGMIPIVFYFTSRGTWNPREQNVDASWSAGFFASQAESMLRGRMDVEASVIIGECFARDSRCYGYFGITPSLVRIPVIGILRYVRSGLTPIFLSAAVILAYWATLQMLQRSIRESTAAAQAQPVAVGYFIAAAAALGPGGSLLFVTRPAVYEEAIAWGVSFVLLALDHVWAWRSGERRSVVPAVIFAMAAANARPTAAIVSAALGLVVFAVWWSRQRQPEAGVPVTSTKSAVAAALCLSLLPALTTAGVFWLKLRSPMPSPLLNQQISEEPHWKAVRQRNGGRTGGLVFAPTELVAYFRPDTVVRTSQWPYFDFRFPRDKMLWVPPLPEGGAYVERFSSVTATMPLPWILNLVVAVRLIVEVWKIVAVRASSLTKEEWIFRAGLLASAATMPLLIVTTHGITNRYLGDFFATSAVGVALAARVIIPTLARRPIAAAATGFAALLLVCWSVAVTLSLNSRLVF